MTSISPHNSRRKSRSAFDTSQISRRIPNTSLRIAAKRTHPVGTFSPPKEGSTQPRWDAEPSRRDKRRRRDISPPSTTMNSTLDQEQHDTHRPSIPLRFSFPASSAEFNVFPKSDRTSRRRASCSSPTKLDRLSNVPNHTELTRLRANAFWELHRSVAETGEGFVQRMRDYECLRSLQTCDSTRKRSFGVQTSWNTSYVHGSDVSDDDDIQIFAGEASDNLLSRSTHSYNGMVCLDTPARNARQSETIYSKGARYACPEISCHSVAPAYYSDGEDYSIATGSSSPNCPCTTPPSLSPSPPAESQALDADFCSILSLPSSLLSLPSLTLENQSWSSERAITELSLALANGAGSLNDYSRLQTITSPQQMDGGEPGELWH